MPEVCETLEEVGARAGCSSATVSRVLNNTGSVSPAVRANVLRVVEEVGYVPRRQSRPTPRKPAGNGQGVKLVPGDLEVILHRHTPGEQAILSAGNVQLGPTARLGEAITTRPYSLTGDFYMHIIGGVMDALAQVGRRGLLQTTDTLSSDELLAEVNRRDCSGVVLLGEYGADLGQFLEKCAKPLVLVDIIHPGSPDVVTIDNMAGIAAAVDHLFELGHRDIGYVGAPFNPSFQERWASFQWKMAAADLPVRPEWVYHGSEHVKDTAAGVHKILTQGELPTAFVCGNDWSAMGVLRAAERAGVKVPDQLSVVGFDDVDAAAMVTPALTTLHVPLRDLGEQAVRQLLIGQTFAQPRRARGCTIRMVPELVVRQSSGPVRPAS